MSVVEMNTESFNSTIDTGKLVMVDFWASWCGPCMGISPVIDEIASDNDGKVIVGKINVDNENKLAMDWGIRGIPTLLFFKNGEQVDRIDGLVNKERIQEIIDNL